MPDNGDFDFEATIHNLGKNRYRILQRNTETWLKRVRLTYYSPHLFRHGNAVFELKNADTIDDLKAICQNLGHSSIVTTDSIYSKFDDKDVKERIAKISKWGRNSDFEKATIELLSKQIQELTNELKKKNRE